MALTLRLKNPVARGRDTTLKMRSGTKHYVRWMRESLPSAGKSIFVDNSLAI